MGDHKNPEPDYLRTTTKKNTTKRDLRIALLIWAATLTGSFFAGRTTAPEKVVEKPYPVEKLVQLSPVGVVARSEELYSANDPLVQTHYRSVIRDYCHQFPERLWQQFPADRKTTLAKQWAKTSAYSFVEKTIMKR